MASILMFLMIFLSMHAVDYGTFGHTFLIEEQDLLEYVQERLLNASAEEHLKLKEINKISEPKEVPLPQATIYRCFFYDPSVTAHQDIKDNKGNIIVAKGTSYNPLRTVSLTNPLLFFNSTKETNLLWAMKTEGTWILTKGAPIELEEKVGKPVYFDQFGSITRKLGIQAIPAKVSQQGHLLKIEEFVVGEKP